MQTAVEQPKSGKDFEELVTWIHQRLHEKAVITPNDKIRDIHSNRLRQIDISIRLKDGPTEFLGIVEVREKSRPVGENYIEEISAKRESVRADAACIVSASGFCKTAIKKAHALNIRISTYKEALSTDWMQCLQLKEITQFIQSWGNVVEITFLEPLTNRIINSHQSVSDALQENVNALIFVTEQDEPKASIREIVNDVINKNSENIFRDIQAGRPKRKRILINVKFPLFFRDATGAPRKLEHFCLEADFWIEVRKTPIHLAKYSNAGTGKALAEIASTSIEIWGEPHKFEIIANVSGEHGSQVSMRLQKQDQLKKLNESHP